MDWGKRAIAGVLITFSVLCVAVGVAFFLWSRNACTNEVLRITETSGVRFVIERSSCDLLGKDESINVYASRLPEPPTRILSGWFRHRSLLFRYDPGSDDNPLPTITLPTQADIRIAVPSVSSIMIQYRRWNGRSVSYDIGKTDFPNVSK